MTPGLGSAEPGVGERGKEIAMLLTMQGSACKVTDCAPGLHPFFPLCSSLSPAPVSTSAYTQALGSWSSPRLCIVSRPRQTAFSSLVLPTGSGLISVYSVTHRVAQYHRDMGGPKINVIIYREQNYLEISSACVYLQHCL